LRFSTRSQHRERKGKSTIEQINVTPVKKSLFILSKLIPYWMIGIFILTVCLGLAARKPADDIPVRRAVRDNLFRAGACCFQLLGHDAAGNVRDVLLHYRNVAYEWDIYPDQKYAGVGADDNLFQFFKVFRGSHACHISER
jgi:hypothetical protein